MMTADDLAVIVSRVSRLRGVPGTALLAMTAPVMKRASKPAPAQIERLLLRKAGDWLALRARLLQPAADPAIAERRRGALEALEAGHLAEVDKALALAELRLLDGLSDIAALTPEMRLLAGETRADRGATSMLELAPESYREAADRLGEAAALIGLINPARSHQLALAQADALRRLGEDFADPSGFEAALSHLRALLDGLDNFENTVLWATTQERIGLTLTGFAAATGRPALRVEAASCYRTALEDLRQAQAPALWGRLQRQLGTLALEFGEERNDEALIEEAVAAFQDALRVIERDADAKGWSQAQYDLGRAQFALGERTGGMALLEGAFNAFNAAATLRTRELDPRAWSDLQDRMGQVLRAMGDRYAEPVVLEEAVAFFGRALEERGRENSPLLWAKSSAHQALANLKLAERQKDAGLAQKALTQMMAAMEALRAGGDSAGAAALQAKLAAAAAVAQTMGRR